MERGPDAHGRARGVRPVQIWVPDVRAAGFAQDAHAQSVAVAHSERAGTDQTFVDEISWCRNDEGKTSP